jgi:hypothetical protein
MEKARQDHKDDVPVVPTTVRIIKLPPGPQDVHFQEYSHDEYLGEPLNVNKPIRLSKPLGTTILDTLEDELGEAYKVLDTPVDEIVKQVADEKTTDPKV